MSIFGTTFKFSTFGESHGKSVGAVVDGVPPQMSLTEEDIQPILDRRRPGQSRLTTARAEADQCIILSGVCPFSRKTLGTPICVIVNNKDQRTMDYADVDTAPRPGHAEYTYQMKYGIRAKSGGGRASARETIARCIAGAIAEKALVTSFGVPDYKVVTFVSEVGQCKIPSSVLNSLCHSPVTTETVASYGTLHCDFCATTGRLRSAMSVQESGTFILSPSTESVSMDPVNFSIEQCAEEVAVPDHYEVVQTQCPHIATAASIADMISKCRLKKDTVGGITTTVMSGLPIGLGEPVFNKFESMLAFAMMSLPATKGFSIGEGFDSARHFTGLTHNDPFSACASSSEGTLSNTSNHAGGTLGGITNGSPVVFNVAFKPVSSIGLPQKTANWNGDQVTLEVEGRHDPCVLPRCPPLIDAMASVVAADAIGMQRARGDQSWKPSTAAIVQGERTDISHQLTKQTKRTDNNLIL